jgi:hypothetical protein
MSHGQAISASDPQAVEKLTEKLEACKERQKYMKDVNAYYRKHKTCKDFPGMSLRAAAALDVHVDNAYSLNKQPYPSYELTNNNAEIKRLEKRITELTRAKEVGFIGWEFEGGRAEVNTDLNRLQLFFDKIPSEQMRIQLKHKGFRWAPTQNAWQRQLTANALYAADRLDFIAPTDGRTVREHQPRVAEPERDSGAR